MPVRAPLWDSVVDRTGRGLQFGYRNADTYRASAAAGNLCMGVAGACRKTGVAPQGGRKIAARLSSIRSRPRRPQNPAPGVAMHLDVIKAAFLGIVEGLTEFIPVSSTGHLLLVGHFLGFDDEAFGKSFDVLIQLGAILALLSIYFSRLWRLFLGMFTNRDDQRFVIGVLVAFLPAMVIGALAYSTIKSVLFNVWIVCSMFLAGGLVRSE